MCSVKVLIVLIPWVSCIIFKLGQKITNRNLHKINDADETTTYDFNLLIWFEWASWSNTYSWLANIYQCFSLLHDIYFETDLKTFCRIDESIIPFYNTIHWPLWWVEKIEWQYFYYFSSLFSGENWIWSPCLFVFLFFLLSLQCDSA